VAASHSSRLFETAASFSEGESPPAENVGAMNEGNTMK